MSRCLHVLFLMVSWGAILSSVVTGQVIDPDRGADPRVDYRSLDGSGPWGDRSHLSTGSGEVHWQATRGQEVEGPGPPPGFNGDSYSIEAKLGATIDGEPECFSVHMSGMDDNIVVFDVVAEFLDPYVNGTQPVAFESSGPPSSIDLEIFTNSGVELFPSGFVDPSTAVPLTDACLVLGFADPLLPDQTAEVVIALVGALGGSGTIVPPTDVTTVFSNPWDGRVVLIFPGLAGVGINHMFLGITVQATEEGPIPLGDEFTPSETMGSQEKPAVAARTDGSVVVVWRDRSTGGAASTIRARHFTAEGAPTGPSVALGSVSPEDAMRPAIAAGNDDFLVVWDRDGGTDQEIFARRLDAFGAPLGSEFQVNGYTSGDQSRPVVAANGPGEFLVVWQSAGSPGSDPPGADDTSGLAIVGRRVSTTGTPLGSDYQVNSYTTDDQACPSLVERGGVVAVAWQSGGTSTDMDCVPAGVEGVVPIDIRTGPGLFGQDSILDDLQINTSTTSNNLRPKVAMRSKDVFVVWEGDPLAEGVVPIDIQGRRYSFTGLSEGPTITLGDEVVIDDAAEDASRPDVAVLEGVFVTVTWDRDGGTDGEIFGKFGGNLSAVAADNEFQVNSTETGIQQGAALAATPGGFMVVWQSDPSNGVSLDDLDLMAQRFSLVLDPVEEPVFADGFESGDTVVWSNSTP